MLKCPECDADLKQDFGMVTCEQCKAVLMIDISGQVQTGSSTSFDESNQESFYDPDGHSEETTQFNSEDIFESMEESFEEDSPEATNLDEKTEVSFEDNPSDVFEASQGGEYEDEPFDDVDSEQRDAAGSSLEEEIYADSTSVEAIEDEELANMESTFVGEDESYGEDIETFPMAMEPDPNPVDITEYANSEESNLEDGELLYDLYLGRLDSKDLREALKLVLLDEKLKINHHDYMEKIKRGQVLIPDLNPIKAKRIVEQLQYLDLDIKWKQKRVIIEAVDPEIDDGEEGDIVENAEI